MVGWTDELIDALAWYARRTAQSAIATGIYARNNSDIPVWCRWCGGSIYVKNGATLCRRCDGETWK